MKFDAIVIGSGQAGNPLSDKLADQGGNVALIERSHLGGTCINTGCTPTKTRIAGAQVAHSVRNASRWGVSASGTAVDLPAIVSRKNQVVESFRSGQQRNVDKRPTLHLHRGQARFTGPKRLEVDGETLEGDRIFINTGTRPAKTPNRSTFAIFHCMGISASAGAASRGISRQLRRQHVPTPARFQWRARPEYQCARSRGPAEIDGREPGCRPPFAPGAE